MYQEIVVLKSQVCFEALFSNKIQVCFAADRRFVVSVWIIGQHSWPRCLLSRFENNLFFSATNLTWQNKNNAQSKVFSDTKDKAGLIVRN